jgi:hypothetical protein
MKPDGEDCRGRDPFFLGFLSWKIVIVALAVYTGTFLAATAIAEVVLRFTGKI